MRWVSKLLIEECQDVIPVDQTGIRRTFEENFIHPVAFASILVVASVDNEGAPGHVPYLVIHPLAVAPFERESLGC